VPTAVTQLDESLKLAQKALKDTLAENDEIAESCQKDGQIVFDDEKRSAFQSNLAKAKGLRADIELFEDQMGVKSWANAPASDPVALAAGVAAHLRSEGMGASQAKTLGQMFVESPEFQVLGGGSKALTMPAPFRVEASDLGGFNQKDVYTSLPGATIGGFGTPERAPMVPRPHRTIRVRDLFPVRQTNANTIEYFRVLGYTNAA
jgi:hypothetical protein